MVYQCPQCKVKAEIDKPGNKKTLLISTPQFLFPGHPDCELAKPTGEIDLDKLDLVD